MMRVNPHPVETADDLPGFCSECGRALVVEDRTDGFDRRTGAPILVAYAFCRGSWLDRLLHSAYEYHDSFVVYPRPKADVPPRPLVCTCLQSSMGPIATTSVCPIHGNWTYTPGTGG